MQPSEPYISSMTFCILQYIYTFNLPYSPTMVQFHLSRRDLYLTRYLSLEYLHHVTLNVVTHATPDTLTPSTTRHSCRLFVSTRASLALSLSLYTAR